MVKYPKEFERKVPLKDGTALFFRPIKPTDEKMLRDMCYACSEKSIAFRFFKNIKTFPHEFIQEFSNVDFTKNMAIVGLTKGTGGEEIVGVGRYYYIESKNRAEVSFLVRGNFSDETCFELQPSQSHNRVGC